MTAPPGPDGAKRQDTTGMHRVVVKVGSGVIAAAGVLQTDAIARLAADVAAVRKQGREVILVASGAVAGGYKQLGCPQPPVRVVERQASACIGQYKMIGEFAAAFARDGCSVAQLLMMEEDIENRRRFISARHTIQMLLERHIVPIINENDALADDREKVGDNDHLAALVTNLCTADLLIILSSVPGIYRKGAADAVLAEVNVEDDIDDHIGRKVSATGVGGMQAKVSAAKLASRWGVPTIIADGREPGMLLKLVEGQPLGTLFRSKRKPLSARKRWIAFRHKSRGSIVVDAGAEQALIERGASLLPAGIIEVRGSFPMGARVDICDDQGRVFAVGLTSYPAQEVRQMQGKKPAQFETVLGYRYVDEIIGRDDLVILTDQPGARS